MDDLKHRILCGSPGPAIDYPIQLFQLASRGPQHNRSPIREQKTIPLGVGGDSITIDYIRFYFDGLVSHFHAPGQNLPEVYLHTCLGVADAAVVFMYNFEESRTSADMAEVAEHVKATLG